MLRLSILLLEAVFLLDLALGGPTTFLMRHKRSGKYIHPYRSDQPIPNDDPLYIFTDYSHYNSHQWFTLDQVTAEWGYIRHFDSDTVIHPYYSGNNLNPEDGTNAVLHEDRKEWAYFAIDQVNHHIIHIGGKYLHPAQGNVIIPPDGDHVVFHGDVHSGMEFEFVDPNDPNEIVYPYGAADISGEWRLVFSVENPLATHTMTYSATIGKSATESTSNSFQFVWEGSVSAQYSFAKMSTSTSLSSEVQASSSETWHAEFTKTFTITVEAGQSVAVWQRVFIGEQNSHKAVHQSDVFADTESPIIPPGQTEPIKYRAM